MSADNEALVSLADESKRSEKIYITDECIYFRIKEMRKSFVSC